MKYDPAIHHHRSIRLQGYDYSQAGSYFVTICTRNRKCLFGDVVNGEMRLNDAGRMVADEWLKTTEIRAEIELDEWVVMPNHFHGIVVITDGRGDPPVAPMNGTMISGKQGDRRVRPYGTATTIHWRGHGRVQIRRYQTDQRIATNPRCEIMATQLLGTHRSQ